MASAQTHGLLFEKASLDKSYKLNTPASSERGVEAFMKYVNGEILKIGSPITLTVANTPIKLENVYGVNRVLVGQITPDVDRQVRPRAEVAVVSLVNGKFKEVCYFSLDWLTNLSEVKQYSGLTFRADGGKVGSISKHVEVVGFLRQIVSRLNDVVVGKKRFYLPVQDRKLIGRAAFGPLYKIESKKGKDNADARIEGKGYRLSKSGTGYVLRASVGIRLNERDLNIYVSDAKRRVVLCAEPEASSRFKVDGKEYKGVRVTLKPQAAVDSKAEQLPPSK